MYAVRTLPPHPLPDPGALEREMAYIASTASAALAESEGSPAGSWLPHRPSDTRRFPPMLVDLLALLPAVLAGIGGAFLGDKIGHWFKKTRTSGNG
jgi:hypothetical protein